MHSRKYESKASYILKKIFVHNCIKMDKKRKLKSSLILLINNLHSKEIRHLNNDVFICKFLFLFFNISASIRFRVDKMIQESDLSLS